MSKVIVTIWTLGGLVLAVLFGATAGALGVFPGPQVEWTVQTTKKVWSELTTRPNAIAIEGGGPLASTLRANALQPGLTFIVSLAEDSVHRAYVIRADGSVVYEWPVDWWEIWPEPDFLPEEKVPRRQPGASIHGSHVNSDGSILFNFEYLSTIKLNACGDVDWKLENLGHHSIDVLDDGTIWAAAQIYHPRGSDTGHQNHRSPLREDIAQQIAPDGTILREISTLDLFWRNDLHGFLFATSQDSYPGASRDTMHLNDVEVFPKNLPEGIFAQGDVMVSLRNINSVVVFDPETLLIKHIATGHFLRQHDPDFLSGDSYTVFDNQVMGWKPEPGSTRSRILEVTASSSGGVQAVREIYRNSSSPDFYTGTKGRHQRLPNGNVLLVIANDGRVLELSSAGELVWEYRNVLGGGFRGLVTEAQRLDPELDEEFFGDLQEKCSH